eukprot:m.205883 g.205883  ORF g.205883 m.205883 type:complete len:1839 (-) comp15792_c0_seq1:139-5655(-)
MEYVWVLILLLLTIDVVSSNQVFCTEDNYLNFNASGESCLQQAALINQALGNTNCSFPIDSESLVPFQCKEKENKDLLFRSQIPLKSACENATIALKYLLEVTSPGLGLINHKCTSRGFLSLRAENKSECTRLQQAFTSLITQLQAVDVCTEATQTTTSPSNKCIKDVDLIFLLDSSSSISEVAWQNEILPFVKQSIQPFSIGPNDVRVGIITFATDVTVIYNLNESQTKSELEAAISGAVFTGGSTYASLGLAQVRLMFQHLSRKDSGIPRVLVVVTDGNPTVPINDESRALHDDGVQVIAIGIGSSIDNIILETLGSTPRDVFQLPSLRPDDITRLLPDLVESICLSPTETTHTTTTVPFVSRCYDADVVFLVSLASSIVDFEGASSGTPQNFQAIMCLLEEIIQDLSTQVGERRVRIALVLYSGEASTAISFEDSSTLSAEAILDVIRSMNLQPESPTERSISNVTAGLRRARSQLSSLRKLRSSESLPGQETIHKAFFIVFTDGTNWFGGIDDKNRLTTELQKSMYTKDTNHLELHVYNVGDAVKSFPSSLAGKEIRNELEMLTKNGGNFSYLDQFYCSSGVSQVPEIWELTTAEEGDSDDLYEQCCVAPAADVIFMFDRSASQDFANRKACAKSISKKVVTSLGSNVGENGIRVAAVSFSGVSVEGLQDELSGKVHFDFQRSMNAMNRNPEKDDFKVVRNLLNRVDLATELALTDISAGYGAIDTFLVSRRGFRNYEVPVILILITDAQNYAIDDLEKAVSISPWNNRILANTLMVQMNVNATLEEKHIERLAIETIRPIRVFRSDIENTTGSIECSADFERDIATEIMRLTKDLAVPCPRSSTTSTSNTFTTSSQSTSSATTSTKTQTSYTATTLSSSSSLSLTSVSSSLTLTSLSSSSVSTTTSASTRSITDTTTSTSLTSSTISTSTITTSSSKSSSSTTSSSTTTSETTSTSSATSTSRSFTSTTTTTTTDPTCGCEDCIVCDTEECEPLRITNGNFDNGQILSGTPSFKVPKGWQEIHAGLETGWIGVSPDSISGNFVYLTHGGIVQRTPHIIPHVSHRYQVKYTLSMNLFLPSTQLDVLDEMSPTTVSLRSNGQTLASNTFTHANLLESLNVGPILNSFCDSPIDLLLMLDDSGSIGETNFLLEMIPFTKSLISKFEVGPGGGQSRIALSVYSSQVRTLFDFDDLLTNEGILNQVDQARYTSGYSTNIGQVLTNARDMFQNTTEYGGRGIAANRVAVLFTDGYASYPLDAKTAAEALKSFGVTLIVVGVGGGIDTATLQSYASLPSNTHVFNVENFNSVSNILDTLTSSVCTSETVLKPQSKNWATLCWTVEEDSLMSGENLEIAIETQVQPDGSTAKKEGMIVFIDNVTLCQETQTCESIFPECSDLSLDLIILVDISGSVTLSQENRKNHFNKVRDLVSELFATNQRGVNTSQLTQVYLEILLFDDIFHPLRNVWPRGLLDAASLSQINSVLDILILATPTFPLNRKTAIGFGVLSTMHHILQTREYSIDDNNGRAILLVSHGDTDNTELEADFNERMQKYQALAKKNPLLSPSCLFVMLPLAVNETKEKLYSIMRGDFSADISCSAPFKDYTFDIQQTGDISKLAYHLMEDPRGLMLGNHICVEERDDCRCRKDRPESIYDIWFEACLPSLSDFPSNSFSACSAGLPSMVTSTETSTGTTKTSTSHTGISQTSVTTHTTVNATCCNIPGWYDSSGPDFDCDFYANGVGRCERFGNDFAQSMDGILYTAVTACCACGGGIPSNDCTAEFAKLACGSLSADMNCESCFIIGTYLLLGRCVSAATCVSNGGIPLAAGSSSSGGFCQV